MNIFVIGILVFVFLTLLLAVFVFIKSQRRTLSNKDQQFFIVRWQDIMKSMESDPKHAILDADKLLDHLLAKKGYSGSLGEKLKAAAKLFTDLNGLWAAHKLRNRIAHEIDVSIGSHEAQGALQDFKRAFRDLGVKL